MLIELSRAEYVWSDRHSYVISVHLVVLFFLHNLIEEFNVELKSVKVDFWQHIEQVLEVQEHDLIQIIRFRRDKRLA